jgi:hypothetical protein
MLGEEVSFASMSIEQVESAIREMPPEDRRRLLLWLDEHRYELFAGSDEVTEAQKTEVLRCRQQYFDQTVHARHERTGIRPLFRGHPP